MKNQKKSLKKKKKRMKNLKKKHQKRERNLRKAKRKMRKRMKRRMRKRMKRRMRRKTIKKISHLKTRDSKLRMTTKTIMEVIKAYLVERTNTISKRAAIHTTMTISRVSIFRAM
jgi:hypothetical protein